MVFCEVADANLEGARISLRFLDLRYDGMIEFLGKNSFNLGLDSNHLMALTKGKNSTQNTEFILILDDFYHETRYGLMNNKTRYLFRGSFQGFCWLTLTFCLKGPVLGTCYNCVD